jgi:GT2 family glycosyltransferase
MNELENEVWVVDNNSSDGSVEMIRKEFPAVKLIENDENVGFARANNQVLSQAAGDYYLLLNSDTVAPPGSVKALCRYMDENPKAAAAGPKLMNAEGVVEKPLKPFPTLSGELRHCLVNHFYPFGRFFESLFRKKEDSYPQHPARAEVLSAACLMIRRNVVEKVGVLSQEYFLFSEESDYFFRMSQHGFHGYYNPEIEIIHLVGGSRKKRGSIDSEVNFLKSRRIYFKKFHGRDIYMFLAIHCLFYMWSYVAAMAKSSTGRKSRYPQLYRELLKSLLEGG